MSERKCSQLALALVVFAAPMLSLAQPGVPNVFNPSETQLQSQSHFLTFTGSNIPQTEAISRAYYAAIDPTNSKASFQQWLVNAGFIANVTQWHSSGPQTIVTGQPAGVYGDNIINTDSHVIVLNAADLGFVRNQFIRCKPSCTARNPTIYTYLENYPVAPFAVGGSNFPTGSSFPTPAEAAAAIASAINRPLGVLGGDGVSPCNGSSMCLERIADVAFEWAPPANSPTSPTRFGQLYAYVFYHDALGITESNQVPGGLVGVSLNPSLLDAFTGAPTVFQNGDEFAPNLDGLGPKSHPAVCLVCHGGKPTNLTLAGTYPRNGNITGFRFLPLDVRNLMFGTGPLSLASQQGQIKLYNQLVLLTVAQMPQRDDQGTFRPPHISEVIRGWYADPSNPYSDSQTMTSPTQNSDWIPKGWREASHGGTAPAGAENVYKQVVGPSCRSCHFNRELSLDFGTYANFHQESDLQQLSLLPPCKANNPDPNGKYMPLAHLTFQRFWETTTASQTMSDGYVIFDQPDTLAADFHYGSVSGYCATKP